MSYLISAKSRGWLLSCEIHLLSQNRQMDDTAKEGLTLFKNLDSLRSQRFQTLIPLLFEGHWV